jgi:hypothetical protein
MNWPAGPGGQKNSPVGIDETFVQLGEALPPGLRGSSLGPAIYPSGDIDM